MKAIVKSSGKVVEVSMECNNSTDFRKATFRTKDGMSYRYDDVELIFDKIKARVKSTGDVFEVSDTTTIYPEHYDKSYNITEIEFLDVKGNSFPKDEPDYWTRLEHTYAGMAMQGMLNNSLLTTGLLKAGKSHEDFVDEVTRTALRYAHALVEKMKNTNE